MTLAIAAATLAGCSKPSAPEPEALTTQAERGPLRLEVAVWPKQPQVGDTIHIRLRMHTPDGYAVAFPEQPDLGGLILVSTPAAERRPADDGGVIWEQTIEAAADLSGPVEIPPLAVKYGRTPTSQPSPAASRPSPTTQPAELEQELAVEAIKLDVRSALTSQDSVVNPRDITGTVLPPKPPLTPLQWAALIGGILAGLAAVGGVVWWLYRLAHRPPPPVPAEQLAREALAALDNDAWLTPERLRACYYELSEIVRAYIENKFGIGAAEMTTEEFIRTLATLSPNPVPAGPPGGPVAADPPRGLLAADPRRGSVAARASRGRDPEPGTTLADTPVENRCHSDLGLSAGGFSIQGQPAQGGSGVSQGGSGVSQGGSGVSPDDVPAIPRGFLRRPHAPGVAILRVLADESGRLRGFLDQCDIVKYGALTPTPDDARRAIAAAREFVDATAAAVRRAETATQTQTPPAGQTGGRAA